MSLHTFRARDAHQPLTIEQWAAIVFCTAVQIPVFRHGRHHPAINDNAPNGKRT